MKIKSWLLALIILLCFSIFPYGRYFESTEYFLQDTVLQSRGETDTRVSIVAIDEESLSKIGRWPWSRKVLAELINKLSSGKPAVIGIDFMLSEKSSDPEDDIVLANAVKNAGNIVLPAVAWKGEEIKLKKHDQLETSDVEFPIPELYEYAITGHINTLAESDNIVRKTLNSIKYFDKDIKSFAWIIFDEYMKKASGAIEQIQLPQDKLNRSNISYTGKPGDFEHVSAYKILNGYVPPEYFKDRIVLIGPYAYGLMDAYLTPLDRNIQMQGVEIHANIIQNFLYKGFKQDVPDYANTLITILLCAAAFLAFRKLSPAKSAAVLAVLIIAYIAAAKYFFAAGYIVQLFYPVAAIVLIYLMTIIYRYIEELLERKRITDVFGKYVAPQVVKQILDNGQEGLKLGGNRREITVLFVDIRGFTPMSEKCQPEEVVAILNDYLNLCAESIFEFGGTLDKFIGDATMAMFNAPLDLPDHAFKAVQTAWAMKQGSEPLQKALEEKFGRSVKFGIGLNTGFAVVGNIGAKVRMDYTAIGDTVNTSARLESNAKPGQILMSQTTYDLVKDRVIATSLGEIKVKGKEQGIPVYQLDGIIEG